MGHFTGKVYSHYYYYYYYLLVPVPELSICLKQHCCRHNIDVTLW